MKHTHKMVAVLITLLLFASAVQGFAEGRAEFGRETQNPTILSFWLMHEPFPDFYRTTKVIIDAGEGKTFKSAEIGSETFKVHMTHSPYHDGRIRDSADRFSGYRQVTGTFVTDDISQDAILNLRKVSEGRYLVLELFSDRSTVRNPGGDKHNPLENYPRAPGARMSETMLRNGIEEIYYQTGGPHMPLRLSYTLHQIKPLKRYTGGVAEEIRPNSGYNYLLSTEMYNENDILPGYITTYVNLYQKFWHWKDGTTWNWKDGVSPGYPPADRDDFSGYRLYVPSSREKLPLVIFMHGTGERNAFGRSITGSDIGWTGLGGEPLPFLQTVGNALNGEMASSWIKFMNQGVIGPAYVALFQSNGEWTDNQQDMVVKAIDDMIANPAYNIDTSRLYIMGLSMGGNGGFNMIRRYPGKFAAYVGAPGAGVVPPGGDYSEYAKPRSGTGAGQPGYTGTPIWLVTIGGDSMEGRTYEGWKGLKAAGANVRWTFWPDTNSRAVIPEVFGDAHAAAWVQFFRNLPAVDEYMVISASTKAAGTPAPGEVDEVVGIAGKNPNDISGESIMQWLFRQHL